MSTTGSSGPASDSFDSRDLQRLLDGDYAPLRERVRVVLSRPELAPVHGLSTSDYREKVLEWVRILVGEGVVAPGYPEEFGGAGDPGAGIALMETAAHADLSLLIKVGVQFGLWGGAVLNLGTRTHHERYLEDIASLALPGCFAMTERDHGSDVQSLRTTATYDPQAEEFVIATPDDGAHKEYIGNAATHGQMAAVFAQLVVDGTSHGVHALVVPIRDRKGRPAAGVRIEDCGEKLGLNGVDNGRLWFDDVRVPREALLDRYGAVSPDGVYSSPIENPDKRFFTMLGTLVQGRVAIAGASISASKSALTIAVRHALRRRQFGPPVGEEVLLMDYRTHQRRLIPRLAATYALHFAQDGLRGDFHRAFTPDTDVTDRERRELEARAAGLKALATWHAVDAIQASRECCGGAGYMAVNRFAGLKADVEVFTTFEGDNTVLMQLVAKSLLTNYKDQFGGLDPVETIRFVAGEALETFLERVFARKIGQLLADVLPAVDDADPLDRSYQIDLFRWREERMLASLARRLKRWVDDGQDPFQVFLSCQDHAVVCGRAHIDRVVLEAFADAVSRCEDPEIAPVLDSLCSLYALSSIEFDSGWFQDHGRLASGRSKAITRAVGQLCFDLRVHAGGLVDSFGIPDAVLAAPIGVSQGAT